MGRTPCEGSVFKKGGSFDKTILHTLRSRLKKRESKYHCCRNLEESRMIFLGESR